MDIYDKNFGSIVRQKLREELHMTQTELAQILGITPGYLSDILNDNRFSVEVREKIVQVISERGCAVNGR